MESEYFIAVDLGAGSGRVILGEFNDEKFFFEVIHRFPNSFKKEFKHQRWSTRLLFDEIRIGLKKIAALNIPIKSIGVDTWGVDFGLFDSDGKLIEEPVCYRDPRTDNIMQDVFKVVPKNELFNKTGIQFLPFNTIFQLFAQNKMEEWPAEAKHLLMMPDIFNYYLSGKMAGEFTMASTSQLLNTQTQNWDEELCQRLKIDREVLPMLKQPGDLVGTLSYNLQIELNLPGVEIIAVASHDTGSAVAGTPLQKDWAYISSGTWSLVGIETDSSIINELSMTHQMTNEGGVYGSNRFLKNVMGLWILESCRKIWNKNNKLIDYNELIRLIKNSPENNQYIYPDDLRFLNPENMVDEIGNALELETLNQVEISKIIFDSLALRYRSVIKGIQEITGKSIKGIQIIGGGSQNDFLNQATANATGLTVIAGPVEATAIGNLLVQATSAGRFRNLNEGRKYLSKNIEMRVYKPRNREIWNTKYEDYKKATGDNLN